MPSCFRLPLTPLFPFLAVLFAYGATGTSSLVAKTWFISAASAPGGDGSSWDRALPALAPALATATFGDTVWLRAGTYALDETARIPSGVSLFGGFEGTESSPEARRAINFAHETILSIGRADASVVEIQDGRDIRLDGLTFTGANGKPGVVLRHCAPTVVLANCRITRNKAPEPGAGLSIRDQSQPRLHNVQVADNHATGTAGGGGFFVDATSSVDWRYGIINGNIADGSTGGGALLLNASAAAPTLLRNCDFYFNEAGENGSALAVTGRLEIRDSVLCSNLSRAVAPGAPLAAQGDRASIVLSGETYVVGNLADREQPRFANNIAGMDRCEMRDAALISTSQTGTAPLSSFTERNDLHTIMRDSFEPTLSTGEPQPGHWVKQTLPSLAGTAAYHCVYLPHDWEPGRKYPLIVVFPGNGPFVSRFGDRSGGLPEHNLFGVGLTGGNGYIVLGLGYLDSRKNLQPTGSWWGDVQATISYTQEAVRFVGEQYGADLSRIVLLGFSRSAFGASFIGLHDDKIAPLWSGILCYDGWESQADMARNLYRHDQSSYNYDPDDFGGSGVAQRFQRLAGRPLFFVGGRGDIVNLNARTRWPIEFFPKTHRNHNVSWAFRDTPERAAARAWLKRVLVSPEPR